MNRFFSEKKVLVLAPHIDDGEFGCGGVISRCIEENSIVKYVAFSDCKDSLQNKDNPNILREELLRASSKLKINVEHVEVLDFEVRKFDSRRQEVLQTLIDIKSDYNPDIVFTPCTGDFHQDHQVISRETTRAFKNKIILGYELPWNNIQLPSDFIVHISKKNLSDKINAIECYQSQEHRGYHNEEYIKALARTRGVRIGKEFAEAYELIRAVID